VQFLVNHTLCKVLF